MTENNAESVRHEIIQPKGYIGVGGDNTRPWFDDEYRVIVLLCHEDGSVTWEMRAHGEVLEPERAALVWRGRVKEMHARLDGRPSDRCPHGSPRYLCVLCEERSEQSDGEVDG